MKTFRKIIAISLSVIIMLAAASARYEKTDKKKEDKESTTVTQTTTKAYPPEKTSPNIRYFVHKSAKADKSYFDDVVFIGDSVSKKLDYYDMENDCLGNAIFLTSISLGVANCLWGLYNSNEVHPMYNGTKMRAPDAVIASGRSKVYIMLGMNDLNTYGVDGTLEKLKELISEIKTGNPAAEIFMQSVTPIYGNKIEVTNELVNSYNTALSELCRQNKWNYLDVASVLRDDTTGGLPLKYCGDPEAMGIHFNSDACQVWVNYLYTHTA